MVEQFEKDTGIDLFDALGKKRGLKSIAAPITDVVDSYFIAKIAESSSLVKCKAYH